MDREITTELGTGLSTLATGDVARPTPSSSTTLTPAALRGSVLVLIQFDVCEEIKVDELRKIFGARTAEANFKHHAPRDVRSVPTRHDLHKIFGAHTAEANLKHQAPGYVRYQRPPVEESLDPLILESGERLRSEERRVGEECRSRWSSDH